MAIVNGIGAITGIIAPFLVGLLTPDVSDPILIHTYLPITNDLLVSLRVTEPMPAVVSYFPLKY